MRQHPNGSFSLGEVSLPDEMLLNVGVWGMGPRKLDQFVDMNRSAREQDSYFIWTEVSLCTCVLHRTGVLEDL